jgi:hypothetical protein
MQKEPEQTTQAEPEIEQMSFSDLGLPDAVLRSLKQVAKHKPAQVKLPHLRCLFWLTSI